MWNLKHQRFLDFLRKLKRSISYFKLGWSSEDWDYGYLLTDFNFKLNRLKKEMLEYNLNNSPNGKLSKHFKVRLERIHIIEKLIKRLENEYYLVGLDGNSSEEEKRTYLEKDKKASKLLFNLINTEFRYWWT